MVIVVEYGGIGDGGWGKCGYCWLVGYWVVGCGGDGGGFELVCGDIRFWD